MWKGFALENAATGIDDNVSVATTVKRTGSSRPLSTDLMTKTPIMGRTARQEATAASDSQGQESKRVRRDP